MVFLIYLLLLFKGEPKKYLVTFYYGSNGHYTLILNNNETNNIFYPFATVLLGKINL